jgi:hypothetical protein
MDDTIASAKKLSREKTEEPSLPIGILEEVKEVEQRRRHRDQALAFILINYTLLLASTVVIIFFQGFNYRGFKLDTAFLNWLGGATIAEVAVIAGVVFRSLFGPDRAEKPSPRLAPGEHPEN